MKRVRRLVDKMKMLLLAVITAHYVHKNAAKETIFAGDRLVRVPFEMCIRKDTTHSVFSAKSVGERRWILQEFEAPCQARRHQHFCAIAHKALDTPVHTLRMSCAGCVDNITADTISDRDVVSDRVREKAAGHNAVDTLGSARQLLSFELAVDIAVARDIVNDLYKLVQCAPRE